MQTRLYSVFPQWHSIPFHLILLLFRQKCLGSWFGRCLQFWVGTVALGQRKSIDRLGKSDHQIIGTNVGPLDTGHGLDDSLGNFFPHRCRSARLGKPTDLNKRHRFSDDSMVWCETCTAAKACFDQSQMKVRIGRNCLMDESSLVASVVVVWLIFDDGCR